MNENIGKFIAYLRKERNMTQQELAEKLGVSDRSVSNWENGKCLPDISLYKDICELFDVTISELLNARITDWNNSYYIGGNPVVELLNYDKVLYHTHDEKTLRRINSLLNDCTNIELITVYDNTSNIEKYFSIKEYIKVPYDFSNMEETDEDFKFHLLVFNSELDYLNEYYHDSKHYLTIVKPYDEILTYYKSKDDVNEILKIARELGSNRAEEEKMNRVSNSILGLAIGDAMGVPVEFCTREKLQRNPVTEMVYTSEEGLPEGTWSDDTAMTLATIDSLNQKTRLDYADIMDKWVSWLDDGKYTSNGHAFDVGRTCLAAITKFVHGTEPLKCGLDGEHSNGNGSLMRFLPIALYTYYNKKLKEEDVIRIVNEASSLTHAHEVSRLACYIYTKYIHLLLDGHNKEEAYKKLKHLNYSSYSEESIDRYKRILKADITKLKLDDISSSGYVVDTLEVAFWCLLTEDTFEDTIIKAVNLGQDTDTIAAIAGSMAGIIYGYNEIPIRWLASFKGKDYITLLANEFEDMLYAVEHYYSKE